MKYIRKHRINEAIKMPNKGGAQYGDLIAPVVAETIKETASEYILNNYVENLIENLNYKISPVADIKGKHVAMDVDLKPRHADITVYVVGYQNTYPLEPTFIFGPNLIAAKNMLEGMCAEISDKFNVTADAKFEFRYAERITDVNIDNILSATEERTFFRFNWSELLNEQITVSLTDISVKDFADCVRLFKNLPGSDTLITIEVPRIEGAMQVNSVSEETFGGIPVFRFVFYGIYPDINDLTWIYDAFPHINALVFRKLTSRNYDWYIDVTGGGKINKNDLNKYDELIWAIHLDKSAKHLYYY